MIGKTIGHYEIIGELGAGGMGTVYRARDLRLEREVALKFLHPNQVSLPDRQSRFLQEARALASLDHPNICTVYDLAEDAGRLYIVMAVVAGGTLADLLRDGPLDVERAVSFIRQVAQGLANAHDQGIVHRDIKSGNIMVTEEGVVKILDFGLAWSQDQARVTLPGTILGTPSCMSPEQARGEEVDFRTDVWALGVLLYEMLRGMPPFQAEFAQAVVYRVLNEDPEPLGEFRSDIPAPLHRLMSGALAKDPAGRPASATEFLNALEEMAKEVPEKLAPEPETGAVAVLDFQNISDNPEDSWLSGGISETITVDLKRVKKLTVVPRDRVTRALEGCRDAGSENEAALIGVTVGAAWVVWGGYQKMGDSIRITAHVSASVSGDILHSVKIDGSMAGIFDLQDRIVAELLGSLAIDVSAAEQARIHRPGTRKKKAYEYYAKGRQIYNRGEMTEVDEVVRLFEKALEIDPGYALAFSGLSSIYLLKFISGTDPSDLDEGIRLAEAAIELDPHLADPHTWLTYFLHRKGLDTEAVAAGRRAVALEPNNGVAHYFLGIALVNRPAAEYSRKRCSEGVSAFKQCLRYSPHYQAAAMMLGWLYMLHGQYDQAEPHLMHAAELEYTESSLGFRKVGGMTMLGNLRFRQGRMEEAHRLYLDSREYLESFDHVYRDTFLAQNFCGLGDLALSAGNNDAALEVFGQAVDLAEAKPERLGIGYFFVRGTVGMGRAFFALDVNHDARVCLDRASAALESGAGFSYLAMWEGNLGQARFELARAWAQFHDLDQAMVHLAGAIRFGWRDLPELDGDPAFAPLEGRKDLHELLGPLRGAVPLP